ncbi:MAG: DUF167 family protein [Desulfobulbaceae bacterium]|nr:DUF167 family protein [Desulfobulbaceae bacterium]HIJ79665.1 YggU family protein [Deltaproteobacteria bacterium]
MSYLLENEDGSVTIALYIQPKASRNRIVGLHGNALKLSITAPPVDGKANEAVSKFIAKLFKVPKTAVDIVSGQSSRNKRIRLETISLAEAEAIIQSQLD